jgi:endonuclease YncB( thermonuclease family)
MPPPRDTLPLMVDAFHNRPRAGRTPRLLSSPVNLDQYGRTVARCSIDGVDVAEWLVRNGLALDWPLYSKGKYDTAQREAEHAGQGIWQGGYVAPWLFRVCMKRGGRPGECSDDANMHP